MWSDFSELFFISDKREGNTSCIAQSPLCMNGSIEPGHKAKGKLS